MVRFVGQVVASSRHNVVGVVLEEKRATSRPFTDGYFHGVKVVDCPNGYGAVVSTSAFERMLLKVTYEGNEYWICRECHHPNPTPRVSSLDEYLNMPVELLDALLRCRTCPPIHLLMRMYPCCDCVFSCRA